MPFSHAFDAFDAHLLNSFDVIHWDQRGSGKSYNASRVLEPLSLSLLIDDLRLVIGLLRTVGGYREVVCVGHSWGSLLGLAAAARFPDLMDAFIGTGQVVDDAEAQILGRAFCMKAAQNNGDTHLNRRIAEVDAGPLLGSERLKLSALIAECGGLFGRIEPQVLGEYYVASPFTHPAEEETQETSVARLVNALWPEVLSFNFLATLASVKCRVLFLQGEADQVTPPTLLTSALATIDKETRPPCEVIPATGHFPFWEDPAGFAQRVTAFALR